MTKKFQYITDHVTCKDGKWVREPIVLQKVVTDRMEEREMWKKVYACNWFKQELAKRYGKGFIVSTHDSGFSEIEVGKR